MRNLRTLIGTFSLEGVQGIKEDSNVSRGISFKMRKNIGYVDVIVTTCPFKPQVSVTKLK